jgi:hypothetical protein
MKHVILDPIAQEASLIPLELLAGHDLTGKTVIDVADDYTLAGKIVDWDAMTVSEDIVGARAAKWAEVVAKRKSMRAQGFAVNGYDGRFQSDDEEGLINLICATLAALIAVVTAQPFSVNWTLSNNITVTLSKTQIVSVFIAGVTAFMAIQTRARQLRAEIDAATTLAGVAAIDPESGWQ